MAGRRRRARDRVALPIPPARGRITLAVPTVPHLWWLQKRFNDLLKLFRVRAREPGNPRGFQCSNCHGIVTKLLTSLVQYPLALFDNEHYAHKQPESGMTPRQNHRRN